MWSEIVLTLRGVAAKGHDLIKASGFKFGDSLLKLFA